MKTVLEAKVFKNGGSSAIRIPASFKLSSPVVYLEIDDDTGDIIIHRDKPQRFAKLLALHSKNGQISESEWHLERDNEIGQVRESIQEMIDAE